MQLSRRRAVELVGLGAMSLSGCLGGSGSDEAASTSGNINDIESDGSQWFDATLEDVRAGESFRIADFEEPVLVQTFAVWCSTCDEQERQVDTLRSEGDTEFAMVSINVDPNEDADAVREHATSNGYEWQWVTPPSAVTESLVDQFGTSVTHPPNAPMILLCPDGRFERLENGVKSPETLRSELETC